MYADEGRLRSREANPRSRQSTEPMDSLSIRTAEVAPRKCCETPSSPVKKRDETAVEQDDENCLDGRPGAIRIAPFAQDVEGDQRHRNCESNQGGKLLDGHPPPHKWTDAGCKYDRHQDEKK